MVRIPSLILKATYFFLLQVCLAVVACRVQAHPAVDTVSGINDEVKKRQMSGIDMPNTVPDIINNLGLPDPEITHYLSISHLARNQEIWQQLMQQQLARTQQQVEHVQQQI